MKNHSFLPAVLILLIVFSGSTLLTRGQENTTFSYLTKPYLQNLSDSSVTVMWLTSKSSSGWLEYGENELAEKRHYQSQYGLIEADLPVYRSSISGLKPGTRYYYRVVTREIIDYGSYRVTFGDTLYSDLYFFNTPEKEVRNFTFLAFNDVHDRPGFIEDIISIEGETDFIVYLGDVMGHIENREKIINSLIKPSAEFFATNKPFYLVRGNHESRGSYARNLIKYIHNLGEQFYYTFSIGPVLFIVLDCGEDKADNHGEYSGLVDFDAYRSEQALWLNRVIADNQFNESMFKVVLSHFPVEFKEITADEIHKHGRADVREKFGKALNNAGADLWLSGHTHRYRIITPEENDAVFPVVTGGGHIDQPGCTYTRVDYTGEKLIVSLKSVNGELIEKLVITSK